MKLWFAVAVATFAAGGGAAPIARHATAGPATAPVIASKAAGLEALVGKWF